MFPETVLLQARVLKALQELQKTAQPKMGDGVKAAEIEELQREMHLLTGMFLVGLLLMSSRIATPSSMTERKLHMQESPRAFVRLQRHLLQQSVDPKLASCGRQLPRSPLRRGWSRRQGRPQGSARPP